MGDEVDGSIACCLTWRGGRREGGREGGEVGDVTGRP